MRNAAVAFLLVSGLVAAQGAASRPVRAAGPPPTREAFEAAFKVAQDAASHGRAKAARDQVTDLLRVHEGADYVFAKKTEIGALVKSCCFAIKYPDPDPKTLVSGDLVSWDASSGAIKLRYSSSKMADWGKSGSTITVHPLRFRGPYSIELKGASYPAASGTPIAIIVCATADASILAIPGAEAETQGMESIWRPARLIALEGAKETELAKKEHPPVRAGKPYAIRVRVADAEVAMTNHGQAMLSGRRLKEWGSAGFEGASPDEILLEGRAETSWIQGLVDQAREKNRADFERSFSLPKELPDWLLDGHAAEKADAADAGAKWPDDIEPSQRALVGRAETLLKKGDSASLATGILLLERAKPAEVPENTRCWLLAQFLDEADRVPEADAMLDKVRAGAPKFRPADCFCARLLVRTGHPKQAADLCETLLAKTPADAGVVLEAARSALAAGRAARAKAIIDAALAQHVTSEDLEHENELLVKAINGPSWSKRFEAVSQNFVVASDIDKKTCEEASRILEDGYLAYSTWLERVPNAGTERFKVYLFSGEAGYQGWTHDIIGAVPIHTAGLYTPLLKILLIWNLPSREEMMRTVRHEGFHQYLDRLVADPPSWFNEGMAEYFENARFENGSWKEPAHHPQHEDWLANGRLEPLATFLYGTRRDFYRNAFAHYAQAWAFVTFLRQTTPENKQLFQKFWGVLRENVGPQAAVARVFTESEIARLQRDFPAWVRARR